MKEVDELQLKNEINEISKRIKKIMQKVEILDPTRQPETEEDAAENQ